MSEMQINQVLAQMRAMAAQAQGAAPEESGNTVNRPDFAMLLQDSLEKVNEAQQKASGLRTDFEMGKPGVELPEVMVALQKASVSFQAVTQVRNKLLNAYQEIMNMQV